MPGSLFEVIAQSESSDSPKFVMKIYDTDEVHKYQNEVEKLELLAQIMVDMGVKEQSFHVEVIDSFSHEVSQHNGSSVQALCIVMEHVDLSVSEFLNSLNVEPGDNTTNNGQFSMEYSISDEEDSAAQSHQDKGQIATMRSNLKRQKAMMSCMKNNGQNGLGLSLELVKNIGF